jgi:hypothetical protein
LPWSFILEDRTWSLVLACRKCNNEKRDQLTNMTALENLCAHIRQLQMVASTRIASFVGTLRNGIPVICLAMSGVCMIGRLLTAFQIGSEMPNGQNVFG